MSKRKLQSMYGLKWNPFSPDIPVDAIQLDDAIERFVWRVEDLTHEGGFALLTGSAGSGKSVILRHLEHQLSAIGDLTIVTLTRPQSSVGDFYRELGEAFGGALSASNRWGGFKMLREKLLAAARKRGVSAVRSATSGSGSRRQESGTAIRGGAG